MQLLTLRGAEFEGVLLPNGIRRGTQDGRVNLLVSKVRVGHATNAIFRVTKRQPRDMEHGVRTPDLGRCILLRLACRYGVDASVVLSSSNDGVVYACIVLR